MLSIKSASTWVFTLVILLLSSSTQADIVGTHTTTGVLNVTFKKQGQEGIKTVAASNETWVFNADHSFTRGALTGTWKQIADDKVIGKYNRSAYSEQLAAFWSVSVSDIHLMASKLLIQQVSNGLSIEETLTYRVDVVENGRRLPTKVTVQGSFQSAVEGSELDALLQAFPSLSGQGGQSAGVHIIGCCSNWPPITASGPDPEVTTPPDNQAPPAP